MSGVPILPTRPLWGLKLPASAAGRPVHPLHAEYDPAGGNGHPDHLRLCTGICRHPHPGEDQRPELFRIIFYIPNILSVVVISGIFSAIYKPENGMLNSIIGLFRSMSDPILWKGEKLVIPPSSLPWCGRPSATTWSCTWPPCLPCPSACTRAPIWTVPGG